MLPYPEIAKFGTILGIWAHPDDESFCSAGVMMAAVANGQRVVCATATRGERGTCDPKKWPLETIAAVREEELETALDIMGVGEHFWMDYTDGDCKNANSDEAAKKVASIIELVQPDTIVTFAPDGWSGHDDHKTVSAWTDQALAHLDLEKKPQLLHVAVSEEWYEAAGKKWDEDFNVFFNLDQPPLLPEAEIDFVFKLPPELCSRKLEAFQSQVSQTETMFKQIPKAEFMEIARHECFMRA